MQWLIILEIDSDPIALCRLVDVFRRKGLKVTSMTATSSSVETSFVALVECDEPLMEHMFHFLRRSAGIQKVSYYRNQEAESATHLLLTFADSSGKPVGRILQGVPGARLVFSNGKSYLFEFLGKAKEHEAVQVIPQENCLPFNHIKTGGITPAS